MSQPPSRPKLYHITHVDNLPAIVREGFLVSDATMIRRGGPVRAIGMSDIKRRRVEELDVTCHPGTKVGDYVPFYFCPRSIMLYVIYKANHPGLTYRDGQPPILHLEADLNAVVRWAEEHHRRWCFSLSNAGAYFVEFHCLLDELDRLEWDAIAARDFRRTAVREPKQAEFLLHESFPLDLIERIGVQSDEVQGQVRAILERTSYRPAVEVRPEWYF